MAVFVANSDEAGVGNPQGEFLVTGYVANEDEWRCLAGAWQERVLDGPPRIPYLHMSEIRRAEWREQHGISWNDAENRVSEAVRVLYSMGSISALGSVMMRRDLEEVFHCRFDRRKKIPTGFDEPDYLCFLAYVVYVLKEVLLRYPEASRVNFVVSRKQTVSHRLHPFFDAAKDYLGRCYPELYPLFGELMPLSMENVLPLQAADILAWHMQRYYARTLSTTDSNRLWMLTKKTPGSLHTWQRSELEELANGLGVSFAPDVAGAS